MTSTSKRRTKLDSDLGASVSSALAEARMTQSGLASSTGRSVAYTNQVITGRKSASDGWINLVADCLRLPSDKRQDLLLKAEEQRKQRKQFTLPTYKE